MFAHEVINTIKSHISDYKIQINHGSRQTMGMVVKLLHQAAQYHIDAYSNVFNDVVKPILAKHTDVVGVKVLPFETSFVTCYTMLPYPVMWIDFFVDDENNGRYKRGILCYKYFDILTIYELECKYSWAMNQYFVEVRLDERHGAVSITVKSNHHIHNRQLHDKAVSDAIINTQHAFHLLIALGAKNVTMIENTPSLTYITDDNKCPRFVYKTLMITNNVVRYEKKNNGSYVVKGVMPEHDVAGHPRRCKSGKIAKIPAHKRGDIKNGRIEKEYVFVNGVSRKRAKKIMKGGDINAV